MTSGERSLCTFQGIVHGDRGRRHDARAASHVPLCLARVPRGTLVSFQMDDLERARPRHGSFSVVAPVSASLNSVAHARQGSTTSTPQPEKSLTLRLASTAPAERAMAATWASNCDIGRPALRRSTAIAAHSAAASLSNGKIRPANSCWNTAVTASASAFRRRPEGSNSTPCKRRGRRTVCRRTLPDTHPG